MNLPTSNHGLFRLAATAGYAIMLLPFFANNIIQNILLNREFQDIALPLYWLITLVTGAGFVVFLERRTQVALWLAYIHLVLAILLIILVAGLMLDVANPTEMLVVLLFPPIILVILPAIIAQYILPDSHHLRLTSAEIRTAAIFTLTGVGMFLGLIAAYLGITKLSDSQSLQDAMVIALVLLIAAIDITMLVASKRNFKLPAPTVIVCLGIINTVVCMLLCSYFGPDKHGKTGVVVICLFFLPYLYVFLPATLGHLIWKRRKAKLNRPE